MKSRLSNWKEESDLYEVVTGKMTDKEALKKVDDKKGINNKVIINPKLSEAMEEVGGEVVSVNEVLAPSKQELNIMKKVNLLQLRLQKEKKKTTQKAEQAAKQQEDIPVQQEEVGFSSSAAMAKARKEAELRRKEELAKKKAKEKKEKSEKQKAKERKGSISSRKNLTSAQLRKYDTDGDGKVRVVNASYDPLEAVVEYFYEQGINEEGIDLIIEEVGLDDFVDFVDDSVELLTEEEEGRPARKMNVRTKAKLKKDVAAIKADKSDVVARSTPKDVLSRARTERAFKKRKLTKPAAKKEAPTPVKKAATVIKKARKATVAKARKDFDGDGKRETPKQEHRGVRNKKITKAVAKAKPAQPKKPASKEGLRAKIKSAYDAGVKRHRKATQGVRVFHKGMKAGAKKAVKFAKDVKKVVSEEELKERLGGKGYSRQAAASSVYPGKKGTGDWEDSDRGAGNKAARRAGKKVEKKSPTYRAYVLNKEEVVLEKDLSAAERRALPNKDFALPGKGEGPQGKQAGSYPIPDEKHARSALSLVSQHGTPEEKAKVRAKVKKKFPGIKVSEGVYDSPEFGKSVAKARKLSLSKDPKDQKKGRDIDKANTKKMVGESRDKALDLVRASIIKKHGKGAIYDPKTAKKPSEADKAKAAAERKKRQDADNKAFASRAKKAGYKNPQDYANVVARYGSEDNYKKGKGLGT